MIVCWSDLRWNGVFGRAQQLMMRWARTHDVLFVERPLTTSAPSSLKRREVAPAIEVITPRIMRGAEQNVVLPRLLTSLYAEEHVDHPISWYTAPSFLPFTRMLPASVRVYDASDDVPTYDSTHAASRAHEQELLQRADVVLTGGRSTWQELRRSNRNVQLFASGIDLAHFERAREPQADLDAQAHIARPRIGYFGVIDARIDMRLLAGIAEMRPAWEIVLAGSVMRPAGGLSWPRLPNLHLIGAQRYDELPALLAGWDVALLPFVVREMAHANPTRVAECLAAGKPVVATPVPDIVMPYAELGLAHIASTPAEMVRAIEDALDEDRDERLFTADAFLAHLSWDRVFAGIAAAVITAGVLRTPAALSPQ